MLHHESEGWRRVRLSELSKPQLLAVVDLLAVLHSTGLAHRMSMKEKLSATKPWLSQDHLTSPSALDIIAQHLDSYLHCLSRLGGVEQVVSGLRKVQSSLLPLLSSLRKSEDSLGTRFSTLCLGDLASSVIMLLSAHTGEPRAALLDCPHACVLSPGTDLA